MRQKQLYSMQLFLSGLFSLLVSIALITTNAPAAHAEEPPTNSFYVICGVPNTTEASPTDYNDCNKEGKDYNYRDYGTRITFVCDSQNAYQDVNDTSLTDYPCSNYLNTSDTQSYTCSVVPSIENYRCSLTDDTTESLLTPDHTTARELNCDGFYNPDTKTCNTSLNDIENTTTTQQ